MSAEPLPFEIACCYGQVPLLFTAGTAASDYCYRSFLTGRKQLERGSRDQQAATTARSEVILYVGQEALLQDRQATPVKVLGVSTLSYRSSILAILNLADFRRTRKNGLQVCP